MVLSVILAPINVVLSVVVQHRMGYLVLNMIGSNNKDLTSEPLYVSYNCIAPNFRGLNFRKGHMITKIFFHWNYCHALCTM